MSGCLARTLALLSLVLVPSSIPAQADSPAHSDPAKLRVERDSLWREGRRQSERMRYDQALDTADRVLKLTEQLDGANGAVTADVLEWKGEILIHNQAYKDAVPVSDRAVAIRRLTPDRPWLLADARAFQRYTRRLAEMPQADAERVLKTAEALDRSGRLHQTGRTEEAIQLARQSLADRKKLLGYADHMSAEWMAILANYCRAAGHADADRVLEESRQVVRELYGEQHRQSAALLWHDALEHRRRGEYDKAEAAYARAAETFRTVLGPDHETSRKALDLLASLQRKRAATAEKEGDRESAIRHYASEGRTWAARHRPDHWRVRETVVLADECRFLLKVTRPDMKKIDEAMTAVERAAKMADDNRAREAIPIARTAYETLASTAGPRRRATLNTLWGLAVLYTRAGQPDRAEALFFEAVRHTADALGNEHPDTTERGAELFDWLNARCQDRLGAEDFPELIRLLGKLGEAEQFRNPGQRWRVRSHEAMAAHIRRLARLPAGDRARLDEADDLMAECKKLDRQQRFADARHRAEQVVKVRVELMGDDDIETAEALHALGHLHVELGDLPRADEAIRRALGAKERLLGKEHLRYASTLKELATVLARAGNEERAAAALEEAAGILRRTVGPTNPNYLHTAVNLASVYLALGQTHRAHSLLREAEDIVAGREAEVGDAQVFHALGGMYSELKRPETALVLYEKAGTLWKAEKDLLNYAINRDNVARVYSQLGEPDQVLPLSQEAVALFTDLLGERHPTTARGFTNLAGHYVRSKDYPRALDYQSRAVRAARYNLALAADIGSEAMQLTAFGRFRRDLDAYLTIADRAGSPPEAMWAEVLAWKGAVFTRQAFLRDAARDPALAPLATDLRQTSARLAEVHLGDPQARGKVSGRADPLAEKRDGLERQLAAAAAARGLTPPAPPTPDEVRAALPEDAVLVDYFCRPPRLLAFVARRGRPVVRVDLGELPAVERAVAAWRRVYGRTDRDGSDPGAEVRRLVWTPLEKHLSGTGLVLVSADGALGQFPFAALPGEKPGRYLIEDRPVVMVPVPQVLARPPADPGRGPASLLVVGDVEFGPGQANRPRLPPLPGTRPEAEGVRDAFARRFPDGQATALFGAAATKQQFLDGAPGRRYLHLATHGWFVDPEPPDDARPERGARPLLESGVVFARSGPDDRAGILTAVEVVESDLRGVELVVLSACDTGRGQSVGGEGVLGVQRAFQVSGARAAMVTLWPVDDAATQRLVLEFYRNWWDRGMDKVTALQAAQLAMLRGRLNCPDHALVAAAGGPALADPRARGVRRPDVPSDYRHPYYWAGFVLSGDWR